MSWVCKEGTDRRARRSRMVMAGIVAASLAGAGCGAEEPAVSGEVSTERAGDRIEELALEARELQEETVEVGRRLVEQPEARAEARKRLRELAAEARELGTEIEREAPDAPEARALRRAVERTERGAEQLITFARSERGNLVVTARNSLNEADQELDGVADRLDVRLGDEAQRELDALRREVPQLPVP